MKRFVAVLLVTLVLGDLAWSVWGLHADAEATLACFQPDAPRPEQWSGEREDGDRLRQRRKRVARILR